ncbi:hypothetical protein BD779DRAFT_499211 [Infundibulicybe gibba]|nr:hypothetical protein BD779DRAFT_499211 [Infundibulicybe gibba]
MHAFWFDALMSLWMVEVCISGRGEMLIDLTAYPEDGDEVGGIDRDAGRGSSEEAPAEKLAWVVEACIERIGWGQCDTVEVPCGYWIQLPMKFAKGGDERAGVNR